MLSDKQKIYIQHYMQKQKITKKTIPSIIGLIIIILLSIYLFQWSHNTPNTPNNIQIRIIQNAIDQFLDQTDEQQYESILRQGPLYKSWNNLQSNNNLIKLQWFVLPKNTAIFDITLLKPVEYFSKTWYDQDELRLQINALLHNGTANNNTRKHNNIDIINNTRYNYFNLHCTTQRIHSPLCDQNIEHFLDIFYTFNRNNIWQELEEIARNLKKERHKQLFCENTLKHVQYNQVFTQSIKNALTICDDNTQFFYEQHEIFHTINREITNNSYTTQVYENPDINAYKIMSIAQIILQDIQKNNLHIRRIEAYINQMQALLKRPIIEPIYRDIQYFIINNQILPYIQQESSRNRNYSQIRNQLLTLNRNNTLLQYSGLQNLLINPELIQIAEESSLQNISNSTENIVQWLQTLPYINIQETQLTGQQITIIGDLNIIDPIVGNTRTPFITTGNIDLNRIIIEEITLEEYPLFTSILNTFIASRDTTLPLLYSYINDNIALYRNQQTYQEVCDEIQSITTFTINICHTSLIQGIQNISDQSITYKINRENNTIQSIETSELALTNYLQEKYKNTTTDAIRMPSLIREIILAQPDQDTQAQNQIEDNNIIQIANRFEWFFKSKANDIAVFQDIYYIEFTIQSITFVLAYDIQNNISWPLFFKDIMINNKPLRTQRWSIQLSSQNANLITRFINNPLAYIQEIDPFIYELYQQSQ